MPTHTHTHARTHTHTHAHTHAHAHAHAHLHIYTYSAHPGKSALTYLPTHSQQTTTMDHTPQPSLHSTITLSQRTHTGETQGCRMTVERIAKTRVWNTQTLLIASGPPQHTHTGRVQADARRIDASIPYGAGRRNVRGRTPRRTGHGVREDAPGQRRFGSGVDNV